MIATLALLGALSGSSCEDLRAIALPNVTITAAEPVKAAPSVPAHCRVAAVLTPSADSHIEIEVWLPTENWNGKFEAVGNGGWAGRITYASTNPIFSTMSFALTDGYATAST